MNEELEVAHPDTLAMRHELSVEEVVARVNKVHEVMRRAMKEGHHYGTIPGTPKPSLLKPGAELLCVMFRLDPQYGTVKDRDNGHLTVESTCTLWHIPTGQRCGSGMGSCSTRESRYAYRTESQKCPKCGEAAIIKGKAEYGGGWLCFKKKGGCGEKFKEDDVAITGQTTGRVANEDLADQENTVLKMANKRSLVAAVLNVTAASDIFTQDLEDNGGTVEPPPTLTSPKPSEIVGRIIEQSEEKAERLFPADEQQAERTLLIRDITALKESKGMTEGKFVVWQRRALGAGTLETADLAALAELKKLLSAL